MSRHTVWTALPWDDQFQSSSHAQGCRKEVALGAAVLLAMACLVALLFGGPNSATAFTLDWMETTCHVKKVGVAYRGTCEGDVTNEMMEKYQFHECPYASFDQVFEQRKPVASYVDNNAKAVELAAQPCAPALAVAKARDAADAAANATRNASERRRGAGGNASRGGSAHANTSREARRLRAPGMHFAEAGMQHAQMDHRDFFYSPMGRSGCYNNFLPWALVTTMDGAVTRCSYLDGPYHSSFTDSFDTVERALYRWNRSLLNDDGIRCWVLVGNDCVVAMRNMMTVVSNSLAVDWESGILAFLSIGAALTAIHLNARSASSPRGSHVALPTEEPESPQLTERVQKILKAAARIEEESTTSSPMSTARAGLLQGHVGSKEATTTSNFALEFLARKNDEE
eukprot:TRINITY_DN327_c0_g1_i1.p1 TRINITY_DN327_c0_g1~~TRINITY_DN327_c0_g1_i1.p1  ORF type:complete len:399 (-),score=77.95 TRINITY_DN327_c0_g1_i1:175-1371(-)